MKAKTYESLSKGVFSENNTRYDYRRRSRSGYVSNTREPKPYSSHIVAAYKKGRSASSLNYVTIKTPGEVSAFCFTNNDLNVFHNRLIEKIRDSVGPSSEVGTAILVEGGETVEAAVKSLTEMAAIARAIRRKDVSKLRKAWAKPRRAQRAMAEAGGRWLEFSFGWAPLVQTVHDALEVCTLDPAPRNITVSHKTTNHKITPHSGWGSFSREATCEKFEKRSYSVKVNNPNLWLASSLGFTNPVSMIWEAIPFSFAVDYFIQIGDVIGNLDRFAGVDLSFRYATASTKGQMDESLYYGTLYATSHTDVYTMTRTIIDPGLDMRLTYNFTNPLTSSLKRGLNAASVLAAVFLK